MTTESTSGERVLIGSVYRVVFVNGLGTSDPLEAGPVLTVVVPEAKPSEEVAHAARLAIEELCRTDPDLDPDELAVLSVEAVSREARVDVALPDHAEPAGESAVLMTRGESLYWALADALAGAPHRKGCSCPLCAAMAAWEVLDPVVAHRKAEG